MLALSLSLVFFAGLLSNQIYANLVSRLRIIWLTLFLLYAITTPGRLLFDNDDFYNVVTQDGLLMAATQLLHLLAMLGLIALILHFNSRATLIGGFYQFLHAMPYKSALAERFVARLWLVLYAFEQQPKRLKFGDAMYLLSNQGSGLFPADLSHIEVDIYRLSLVDKCLIFAIMLTIMLMIFGH